MQPLKMMPLKGNIPPELLALPQWVIAGADKVPINPNTHTAASVNSPSDWSTFDKAYEVLERSQHALYMGFVFTESDPFTGIDLDDPTRTDKGRGSEAPEQHRKTLYAFEGAYIEESVSGTGHHIICRGRLPDLRRGIKNSKSGIEIYTSNRYFTVTSKTQFLVDPLPDRQAEIEQLYKWLKFDEDIAKWALDKVDDQKVEATTEAILEKMGKHKNWSNVHGPIWHNQSNHNASDGDYSLFKFITFYTCNLAQVQELFMLSARGPAIQRKNNPEYYLDLTSRNAVARRLQEDAEKAAVEKQLVAAAKAVQVALELKRQSMGIQETSDGKPFYFDPNEHDPADARRFDLFNDFLPGTAGEIARYVYDQAPTPCIAFSNMVAVSSIAGVAGRSFCTDGDGSAIHLYACIVGGAAAGKSTHTRAVSNIYNSVQSMVGLAGEFIGPSKIESANGLLATLAEKPCHISCIGEFGKMAASMIGGSAYKRDDALQGVILDLFHKRVLTESGHKSKDNRTSGVEFPAPSILGDSTPSTLYENLATDDVSNGFLSRFLIVDIGDTRLQGRLRNERNLHTPVPPTIIELFTKLMELGHSRKNGAQPTPFKIIETPKGNRVMNEYDAVIEHRRLTVPSVDVPMHARRAQLVERVAALLAVADNPTESCQIDEIHARTARDFVETCGNQMLDRVHRGALGEPDDQARTRVLREKIGELMATKPTRGAMAQLKGFYEEGLVSTDTVRRVSRLKEFKNARPSPYRAAKNCLEIDVESGFLMMEEDLEVKQKYGFTKAAKLYKVVVESVYRSAYDDSLKLNND